MHAVFPPTKTMYSKKKDVRNFKPTIETSFNSFLTTVKTASEIDEYLIEREKQMQNFDKGLQPQMFKVQDATLAEGKYIVIFNEFFWRFNDILLAVKTLIGIFFVFNVEYPFESQRFYTFVAKYFFGVGVTNDTKMLTIINNLTFEK